MHTIRIPDYVVARTIERRGGLRLFDTIDATRTALIVVDLQNGFMSPGQPAEIGNAREIVPNVNRIASALRAAGGQVVFIQNTFDATCEASWTVYFRHFTKGPYLKRMKAAFARGSFGHAVWPGLDVKEGDLKVEKRRFGAFVPGSSDLHDILQARGIDTLIIVGTATNVCCESTARDAMMMNYKVVFVSDANACRTDEEHNATLGNILALFGDVVSTDEVVAMLDQAPALAIAAE